MSCPSMNTPKIPEDKNIPKDRISVLLGEIVTWADYGWSILQYIHTRIMMFHKEELGNLAGIEYNDLIIKEMDEAEELPKYIEAMKEITDRYKQIAEIWENMGRTERLKYLRHTLRRVLEVEQDAETATHYG